MEFPKTVPREDMDLFLKECRLAGLDITRFKTVDKIQIGERTQWLVLYQLAGDEWEGVGLDVQTTNGGVKLYMPDDFQNEERRRGRYGNRP